MQPNLTAQQIYDLAMESTGNTQPNTPTSPVASNSYNTGRATRSRPATPGPSERVAPAVFTPMPDEVLLPFVNRPAEITQLLNEQPTCRLFQLLKALFPDNMHAMKEGEGKEQDPTKWTFARLSQHLMETIRVECDDKSWVDLARTCIRSRSEALWERFKGALGVPPELEVEDEEDEEEEDVQVPGVPADVLPGVSMSEPVPLDLVTSGTVGTGLVVAPMMDQSGTALGVTVGPLDSQSVCEDEVEEPEAILEPVFANGDPELGHSTEIPIGPCSSGYFPSGASESGYSNRYMENIGESEEEEEDNEKSKGATTMSNPTEVRDEDILPSNVSTPVGNTSPATAQQRSQPSPPLSEHEAAPSGTRRAHFGIPDSPEESPSGLGSPVSDKDHRDREIRALQITTTPTSNTVNTGHCSHVLTSPVQQHNGSPFFRPNSSLSTQATGGAATADGATSSASPASSLKPLDLDPISISNDPVPTPPLLSSSPPICTSPISSASFSNRAATGSGRRRPSETIGESLNGGGGVMSSRSNPPVSVRDPRGFKGFGGFGLTNPNQPYHPALSERGPGNPLFPSSFAHLSVAPTLSAK